MQVLTLRFGLFGFDLCFTWGGLVLSIIADVFVFCDPDRLFVIGLLYLFYVFAAALFSNWWLRCVFGCGLCGVFVGLHLLVGF